MPTSQSPKQGGTSDPQDPTQDKYKNAYNWVQGAVGWFAHELGVDPHKFEFHHSGCWTVDPGAQPAPWMIHNFRLLIAQAWDISETQVNNLFTEEDLGRFHVRYFIPVCKQIEMDNEPRDKNGPQAQRERKATNEILLNALKSGRLDLNNVQIPNYEPHGGDPIRPNPTGNNPGGSPGNQNPPSVFQSSFGLLAIGALVVLIVVFGKKV